MPRGWPSRDGEIMVSQNGYTYVRVKGLWKLKHHIIAEEARGGRRINTETERVIFKDRNRNNFDPDNIEVVLKQTPSKAARKARLEARIQEMQAQLDELNAS